MVGAGRCALEGITVPVLDMELAELESSSSSSSGSGSGSEDSFVFAKDLARSDMANRQERIPVEGWLNSVSCEHARCDDYAMAGFGVGDV
jgi:hypothetical protein